MVRTRPCSCSVSGLTGRRALASGRDLGQPGAASRRDDGPRRAPRRPRCPRADVSPTSGRDGHALAGQHGLVDATRTRPSSSRSAQTRSPASSSTTSSTTSSVPPPPDTAPSRTDPRPGRQQVGEPLARPLGAVLLREGEHPVEHDDDDDGDGQLRHPCDERQPRGHPEHQREEVHHLQPELDERGRRARRRHDVGPSRSSRSLTSDPVRPPATTSGGPGATARSMGHLLRSSSGPPVSRYARCDGAERDLRHYASGTSPTDDAGRRGRRTVRPARPA